MDIIRVFWCRLSADSSGGRNSFMSMVSVDVGSCDLLSISSRIFSLVFI